MDHKQFESVSTFHTQNAHQISQQVRDEAFADATYNQTINFNLIACQIDNVSGPRPIPHASPVSTPTLSATDLSTGEQCLLTRASSGSVALKVLEDAFLDTRRDSRRVSLTAYAERVDLHATGVIDGHGCRWQVSNVVDVFKMGCASWRNVTSVHAVAQETATAFLVALCMRAVVATTYACVCAGENVGKLAGAGLAVALGKTSIAAAGAVVVVSSKGESYEDGDAEMVLPCGAKLVLEAVLDTEEGRVNEMRVRVGGEGRLSGVGKIAVNVMGMVLMGAGVRLSADIEDADGAFSLDGELARVLWMQAAVACHALSMDADTTVPVHDIVRCLTIYRLGKAVSLREERQDGDKDAEEGEEGNVEGVEAERVILAREEAMDMMDGLDGWDADTYTGDKDDNEEMGDACKLKQYLGNGPAREEFLHYGAGSSDLPVLPSDFVTESGLRICARRGVAMQPDTRRSVVIRKGRALWGRVVFEDGRFTAKPLISGRGVLRALVPVQGIAVGPVGIQQFEARAEETGRGDELANILLSGAYGAEQGLWALKKIMYSGCGVRKGCLPSYLGVMEDRVEMDGFGIVSVLGREVVRCMEVIVDDRGRVLIDYEGDFGTMEVVLEGRRLRCVRIQGGYVGARVGTIANSACMF